MAPLFATDACSKMTAPEYPELLEKNNIESDVEIMFSSDANGKLSRLFKFKTSSIPEIYQEALKESVMKALKTYQCIPNQCYAQHFRFKFAKE